MAKTVHGTVTRLVGPEHNFPPRIFFRPEDPGVLRELNGAAHGVCASGEIAVTGDITAFKVGQEADFEVG